MLNRDFGNLDKVIKDSLPFLSAPDGSGMNTGVVISGDAKKGLLKVRDCQSGRIVECAVLQENFETSTKSGNFNLPMNSSIVVYYLDGGVKGVIIGNLYKAVPSGRLKLKDGGTANPGVENFGDADGLTEIDIDSDFGWDLGAWMKKTARGAKIKLMGSGIIVLKSSPFCYQYMLPAKQARLSQFLYDEERGVGYIKRRRTFFCTLPGTSFNANYKMEQIDDIPSAPQATLREEKGFCDKPTSFNSLNHQSDMDISGHVSSALISSIEILKSRAIRRTTIAKTMKVQGTRTLFAPVYKKEERIDGTVVEQCGHIPASPVYNLEIIKSPTGYMHVISRSGPIPRVILKIDPILGTMEIHGDIVALSAKAAITMTAPLIQVNGALSCTGAVVDLQSVGVLNINAPNVNINAQTALTLNAPLISSLPTPLPPVTPPVILTPPIPIPWPILTDNSPLDEVPMD